MQEARTADIVGTLVWLGRSGGVVVWGCVLLCVAGEEVVWCCIAV